MDAEKLARGYRATDDSDVMAEVDRHQAWAKELHQRQLDRGQFHLESADRYASEAVKVVGTIGVAGLVGSSSLLAINPAWIDFDKSVAILAVSEFGSSLIALIASVTCAYLMQLVMANAEHAVRFDYSDEPVKETRWSVWLRRLGWGFWLVAIVSGAVSFWKLWGGFHLLARLF